MLSRVINESSKESAGPLFEVTQFLFVFTAINREFSLLGLDLRYVLFILLIPVIVSSAWRRRYERLDLERPGAQFLLFCFALLVAVSGWLWNGLSTNPGTTSTPILYLMNFLEAVALFLNAGHIQLRRLAIYIVFSGIILVTGQIALFVGLDISHFILSKEYLYVYVGEEHMNLLGQHARYGSFAQDPNYTCLFCVLLFAAAFSARRRGDSKIVTSVVVLIAVIGIALSWSRTILLGCGVTVLILIARMLAPKYEIVVKKIVFICSIFFCLTIPFLSNIMSLFNLQTVLTRFDLWERAFRLFSQFPLFGAGPTAFRSFNFLFTNWYVHPHSTFWSVLAEEGLFGFVFLVATLWFAVKNAHSWQVLLMTMTAFMLSLTNDLTYLQILVLVFVALPASEKYKPSIVPQSERYGLRLQKQCNRTANQFI